jgi:CTP:molybdopterin cytidylyltransferase MocA
LPSTLIEAITSAPFDSKMKRIIYEQEVRYVGLQAEEIVLDIDTPEAYQVLKKRKISY